MPPWGGHSKLITLNGGSPEYVIHSILPDLVWSFLDTPYRHAHKYRPVKKARKIVERYSLWPEIADNIEKHLYHDWYGDHSPDAILQQYEDIVAARIRNTKMFREFPDAGDNKAERVLLRVGRKKAFNNFAGVIPDAALEVAIAKHYGTEHLQNLNDSAAAITNPIIRYLIAKSYHGLRPATANWIDEVDNFTQLVSQVDYTQLATIDGLVDIIKEQLKHKTRAHNLKEKAVRFYAKAFIRGLEDTEKRREMEDIIYDVDKALEGNVPDILNWINERTKEAPPYTDLVPEEELPDLPEIIEINPPRQ